eukprot:gene7942-3483_t
MRDVQGAPVRAQRAMTGLSRQVGGGPDITVPTPGPRLRSLGFVRITHAALGAAWRRHAIDHAALGAAWRRHDPPWEPA